jgi:hypothetical protein
LLVALEIERRLTIVEAIAKIQKECTNYVVFGHGKFENFHLLLEIKECPLLSYFFEAPLNTNLYYF